MNYEGYKYFLAAPKYIVGPIDIRKGKKNHKGSYIFSGKLFFSRSFITSARVNIEVSVTSCVGFSASILSDDIEEKMLFRMDTKGGAHCNYASDCFLDIEKYVPVPHFHYYDKNGFLYAYQTDALKNENVRYDMQEGLNTFFSEMNIRDIKTGDIPKVLLPVVSTTLDPCCDIDFT